MSPELLRAWETRYGLVVPERTSGGLRLYSENDERLVRAMKDQLANGLAASEAARLAKLGDASPGSTDLSQIIGNLEEAFESLDEPAAQQALDRLFASFALESALDGVILPFLRGVGERWARAELSVAGEHFTSNVVGGRLRGLARGWGQGLGPRAVLACPPSEQHELGLVCFGLLLRERGWRITYLGAGTPCGDIEAALDALEPSVVVLAAMTPQRFEDAEEEIAGLARRTRVAIGGAGATDAAAKALGAELLPGDLASGAAMLAP